MSQKSKQHHYVPQAYLRLFSNSDDELYVLNKAYKSIRKTSAKGVAYSHDFYTVDTVDEKDSSEVEETFSKIESRCVPIIKKFAEGETSLPNADYADLAIYIALQYWRTPAARTKMNKFSKKMATVELRKQLRQISMDSKKYEELALEFKEKYPDTVLPPMETLGKWVDAGLELDKFEWDNGSFVHSVFGMAEEIAQGLLRSRWLILEAPSGSQFITSDNPVVMRMSRPLRPFESPAILLKGADKLIPLSNKCCLLITDGKWNDIDRVPLTKNQARAVNRLTHLQANRYSISGSKELLESISGLH